MLIKVCACPYVYGSATIQSMKVNRVYPRNIVDKWATNTFIKIKESERCYTMSRSISTFMVVNTPSQKDLTAQGKLIYSASPSASSSAAAAAAAAAPQLGERRRVVPARAASARVDVLRRHGAPVGRALDDPAARAQGAQGRQQGALRRLGRSRAARERRQRRPAARRVGGRPRGGVRRICRSARASQCCRVPGPLRTLCACTALQRGDWSASICAVRSFVFAQTRD